QAMPPAHTNHTKNGTASTTRHATNPQTKVHWHTIEFSNNTRTPTPTSQNTTSQREAANLNATHKVNKSQNREQPRPNNPYTPYATI
ncbi:hypothetical protein, partial [Corynebacterium sp. p3-SID1056]|uniref:hypothetical protein n=1 Tax=Corynebacterium sp. p3-SID1056 TaxID=2916092 RepID=UPI0021A7573D